MISVRGRDEMAHRIAWELTHGPIPDRLLALHKCDNPACVRPDHLFLGTHKDNTQDMLAKGRHRTGSRLQMARGEQLPQARLTEAAVREIRRLLALGTRGCDIAQQFMVSPMTISDVARGATWRHVV
jgi:hypothetical protein